MVSRYVRYGASPRGVQAMILAAKILALLDNRHNVDYPDLQTALLPALRHRLILNFEGQAEGITPDEILQGVIKAVPHQSRR
jgi:MoxR-like ATPase